MTAVVRSLLFMLMTIVATPPLALAIMLCFPLPHRMRRRAAVPWVLMTIWLIKHVLRIDYRLLGRENIPSGPKVILSKHQSAWETIVLQEVFPEALYVWKKELTRIPFFGWALAVVPMIAIDRGSATHALRQLLKQGRIRLSQGYPIIIFPEGTRAPPGSKRSYKAGGAFLAVRTGVPVVPVALNSGEFWGRNALFKRAGVVTVSIGPAIDPIGLDENEIMRRAEHWIESEMRRISPHLYR